jgi:beta-lactamase regulating signal transducer with metallopeptidase domain
MNTLTHLFDWLLAASLRASLLTLATLLIQAAFHRHLSARMRYALWLPMLVVLLMPVLPQSRWSIEHVFQAPPPPAQIIHAPISPAMDSTPVVFEAAVPAPAPINWQRILLLSWLSVSTGMLTLGSISFLLTLRRFKQARHPASDELLATLAQIAREMHLRQVPRVLIASAVSSPAVTGLLRPTLLLPADFDREFTPAEARLVLKHELMHLKRGDLPLNALMCVLMALHWFNPLLWIAFFKIRADREAACDAQVLHDAPHDRRIAYGHALLKVETAFCPRGFSLGFVGIFQRGATLRSRIQSIAAHRAPHPAMKALITLCIVLMTFLGITRAAPDGNEASLISIEARFIELTFPSDQPSAPDNALVELLAEINETQSNGSSMKAVLHDTQYQTLIRKLSQKKGVDLLTMPRATVRSGQKASMEVTREFASPPEQKPSGQKVGVTLDVLPTLLDKDSLELTMTPRLVEFEGFSKAEKGERKPIYSKRKADTSTKMKPGQTALIDIGSRNDSQTIEDHVDGKVITSTRHLTRRVFVFVTARLVDKTAKDSSKTVFTPGKSAFRPGDSIRITSMTRSEDMLTVELDYALSSTDEATAALYITSKEKASDGKSPAFDSRQHAFVKRGRGSLVLHHPLPSKGLPHVTLYDTKTRQPIGGLYFGTAAEAAESEGLNLNYMTASAEAKKEPANKDQASIPAAPPPANATAVKAAELRKARPQQYDFNKAQLGDVLRFIATDAGLNFFSLPDDDPTNQKLITFSLRGSPFEVLETLCRTNGLVLVLDQEIWRFRAADDATLVIKEYALPQTQASIETILKDISTIITGDETKPAADKPQPSVTFKKEQNSISIKATRLQHTWASAYFQGLSSSAQSGKTK